MERLSLVAAAVCAALLAPALGRCQSGTAASQGAVQGAAAPATPAPTPPPPLTTADARAISAAVAGGPAQGLPAIDVAGPMADLASPDPVIHANAEAALRAAAIAYAAAEHGMRIDPSSVDVGFALRSDYDAAADFDAARQAGGIADWAAGLAPTDPSYAGLVKARGFYAAALARGGWTAVPAGKPLKLGAKNPRVPALRQRLAEEGYVAAPDGGPQVFDQTLKAALADYQTRQGLAPSGALDAATNAALKAAPQPRLAAIDANLERARWLPRALPPDRIEVDTGSPQMTLYQGGQPVLTMRAVVGEPTKRTPTLAAKVTGIVFNPPWIVPPRIAAREIYPKGRGYMASHAFYVSNGRLIQRAGPHSSLGLLKFNVNDPYDIYLHDTPSRSLFAKDKRWLSHGCVRLEKPRELAAALLAPQGFDADAVDAGIAKPTHTVALKVQPPVYILYRTVVADADGHATFREDVYGWDAKLNAALAHPRAAHAAHAATEQSDDQDLGP
ncbi:MAG TPA: L,D-transpeptidase family protein [Caulobacteraceae bacterium]|nr:L,D-transpeptidase family protein [Caulobacteraceae bacterium]